MKKDLILILDAAILTTEIASVVAGDKFSTQIDGDTIYVQKIDSTDNSAVIEIECNCHDFYRYEDLEFVLIKNLIPHAQMVYLRFRDQLFAADVSLKIQESFKTILDDDHGKTTYKGENLLEISH
ncbi:hypothetical protein ACO0LC_15795 [Undibacterium sp. JH2W]|uniref:hypothetical protein n=1 Tax=Undibacterium sp. JH2W TaxID=3413037 RepID=UPI003BF2068D